MAGRLSIALFNDGHCRHIVAKLLQFRAISCDLVRLSNLHVLGFRRLSPGKHIIRFDFKYDGGGIGKGGTGTLSVDGKQVAQSHIERTVCCRFSLDETFDVGADTGSPVIEDYDSQMPFQFTGTLEKLTIELSPQNLSTEDQRELEKRQLAGAIATE